MKLSENEPEIMFGVFHAYILKLNRTIDYTLSELRDELDGMKDILKIWGLTTNLTSDLLSSLLIIGNFEKTLNSTLEYDFYDEICDVIEGLESKLKQLQLLCDDDCGKLSIRLYTHGYYTDIIKRTSSAVRNAVRENPESDNTDLKIFHDYYALKGLLKEKYGNDDAFDFFLKYTETDVLVQVIALPAYLEMFIEEIRKLTKHQYDRTGEELLTIFQQRKQEYKENVFPEKQKQYHAYLKNTQFRFNPVTIEALQDVHKELGKTINELPLGKVYFGYYDSEEDRAYEYNKLQCRHNDWENFFSSICRFEYLGEWIERLIEQERNADKFFRRIIDRSKLKEYISPWIKANIEIQEEWVVVIAALKSARCLKEDVDYEELCNVLNNMFPDCEVKCSWESIRKMLGKKNDPNKVYNTPIDNWGNEVKHAPKARILFKKLEDRDKYKVED